MPDLGDYSGPVLMAYAGTFVLLGGLIAWTVVRGRRARADMRAAEERTGRRG